MSTVTTGTHPKHLLPGVFAFFGVTYGNKKEEWKDLVNVKEASSSNYEEMVAESGLGLASIKAEAEGIAYDTSSQDYVVRATHVTYGIGAIVSREAIEDNKYETKAMNHAESMKISMVETKENVVANIYNRFSTSGYNGGDGVVLGSASHPTRAGNQSNILATAADLSETSLEDLLIQIKKAKNGRGMRIGLTAEGLIVPADLEFEATRIIKSTLQSNTANNDINAIKVSGQLPEGIIVNRYLTDIDAWFVKTNAPRGITLFQRRALEFKTDNDFDTENAKFKSTERYSIVWGDWRALFGSLGA